jgi:glutamine synthetase
MEQVGIQVERQHHEVATAGQAEIDIRFDSLTKTADKLLWFKYIVKNVALRNGKTVTFMPKPLFGDNGSGMHTHQSVWKGGKPLFAGDGPAGLSQTGLHYIGGLLKHARALAAICNPTTNSYKRLVPGFEAPVNLAYSSRNRSAAIRIPTYSPSPKAKRAEFRSPDPSCNPYLAFSAMLMAGLDGVERRIDPGEPLDKDIYGLTPEELKDVPKMPGSLEEALGELKKDHEFPLKGRRLHRGRHRNLDREQDRARAEPGAAAANAHRVRFVLRHLKAVCLGRTGARLQRARARERLTERENPK